MLDPGRYDQNGIPAHLLKDGLTLAVLAFSVAIFNFCLQILRVVWPRGFKGTVHHFLLFAISNAMYMAYFVFMMMKVLTRGSDYPRSIAKIAMHNTLWLYPFTLMPLSERSHDNYGVLVLAGLLPLPPRHRLIMIADVVLLEALLLGFWGLPDFPEGLYGTFFLSCVMVFLLGVFGNTHSLVTFQNGHN